MEKQQQIQEQKVNTFFNVNNGGKEFFRKILPKTEIHYLSGLLT